MMTPEEIRLEILRLVIPRVADSEETLRTAALFEKFVSSETGSREKAKEEKIEAIETEAPSPLAEEKLSAKEAVSSEVNYDQVKDAVLNVAKIKGREASLDLLSEFGVVMGTGKDRKGNITKLKPEQYSAVLEAAKKYV